MIPVVVEYEALDMDRLAAILRRDGEVLVALGESHAKACIEFIETFVKSRKWDRDGTPFFRRVGPLAASMVLTVRMSIRHSRLFELSDLVTMHSSTQTWSRTAGDRYVFRFAR